MTMSAPEPESALSFDEAEAAGVDATLRSFTPMVHTVKVEMDLEVPDGTYRMTPSSWVDLTLAALANQNGWRVSRFWCGNIKSVPKED